MVMVRAGKGNKDRLVPLGEPPEGLTGAGALRAEKPLLVVAENSMDATVSQKAYDLV